MTDALAVALTRVRALVAELHGPASDEDPLQLDSLTVVLLVEALEDRHGIVLPLDEVRPPHFDTVRNLAALVARVRP
jgi:acyl carrier protein